MEERLFQSLEIDALLLTGTPNMRYAAGFTGEGYVYLSRDAVSLPPMPATHWPRVKNVRIVKLWIGKRKGITTPLLRCYKRIV